MNKAQWFSAVTSGRPRRPPLWRSVFWPAAIVAAYCAGWISAAVLT